MDTVRLVSETEYKQACDKAANPEARHYFEIAWMQTSKLFNEYPIGSIGWKVEMKRLQEMRAAHPEWVGGTYDA